MASSTHHPWWQSAVLYEIYVRSFKDTTGNGVGDLQGIIDGLPYLSHTLGVDAIWLTPFYPSPMADFGYDVADYRDVHPLFGDLATFDRLVAAAHEVGLRVVVDFVPNHTSDQHPWFIESRDARRSARRDWYVWHDPKPDGSPPNNWLSVFGGSAWEWDDGTGQYYLHSFLKEQPDLNWRNPTVQRAMFDTMRFWLQRGVDGFRVDAAQFVMKDPQLRDNPLNPRPGPSAHKPLGAYDAQLHPYDKNHPDVHRLFRDLRALLDDYTPPRMALAEVHIYDPGELASWYGALDEVHMPTNFGLLKAPWTAAGVRSVVDALEAALPDGAWPNYVLGTHDDQRIATRLGERGSRQAAVLLLTLRGAPTVYYGDELGLREAVIPADKRRDPWGDTEPELSRDGCRTPMQWTARRGAGFTSASHAWLPIQADSAQRNVETQLSDPDSHLSLYRRLLTLRRSSKALRLGSYHPVDEVPVDCFVFERRHATERAVIAINFGGERRTVSLRELTGRVAVSTDRASEGTDVSGVWRLGRHEAAMLVRSR